MPKTHSIAHLLCQIQLQITHPEKLQSVAAEFTSIDREIIEKGKAADILALDYHKRGKLIIHDNTNERHHALINNIHSRLKYISPSKDDEGKVIENTERGQERISANKQKKEIQDKLSNIDKVMQAENGERGKVQQLKAFLRSKCIVKKYGGVTRVAHAPVLWLRMC